MVLDTHHVFFETYTFRRGDAHVLAEIAVVSTVGA